MRHWLRFILTGMILWSGSSIAQTPFQTTLDSLVRLSIRFTITQQYDSAMGIGKQIVNTYPQHPIGYLFLAATTQSQMMDYESIRWEPQFYAYLDSTIRIAEYNLVEKPENAWSHFYLGSAYAYKAFHESKQNHYWRAFRNVSRGIPALDRAMELDSSLYDAALGVGSYLFWRSQKTKSLNWLPFFKDERTRGIELIKLSIQNGAYSAYAGINALVWIYIELADYDSALVWAQKGARSFPGSRYFLWCLAEVYARQKNHEQSIVYFNRILTSVKNEALNNHYNEIVCHKKIAESWLELGQFFKALEHCKAAEKLVPDAENQARAQKKLDQIREIKKVCQQQLTASQITEIP